MLSNTPIPRKLSSAATVTYKEQLLVIGGLDETSYPTQVSAKVYSTKIKSDGTLENWVEMTDKPLPSTRYEHIAVLANDYVYVLGGYPDKTNTSPQDTIYYSRINDNGTLVGWSELRNTPLPKGLASHTAVFSNGYIFILGGVSGQDRVAQAAVYSAKVKNDGTLENWVELQDTPLPRALDNAGAFSYGEYIFVLGGNNSRENIISNRVYYTKAKNNGTIEQWIPDNSLPQGLAGLDVTYTNGFIFVTGGQYSPYYLIANGYSGKVNPALPTPTPSPTPTPTPTPVYLFGEFLETYNSRRGDSKYVEKYDYNNDGRVSILDWSVLVYKFTPQSLQLRTGYSASELLSTYNKSSTDSGFIPKYDVNTDNIVNKPDYIILNTIPSPTPTPTPIPTAPPKAPDLVVNSVRVLGTPRIKRKNSINVVIQNKGNLSVRTRGILSLKITQPNKTDLGSCNGSFASPSVGKTTRVQIRNCPAFKTSGTHTITATVDSTNTISESNENNNTLDTTINVR